MIELPGYIIDEVAGGSFCFDDIEYKICDSESKWFDKFSFHDKLFIISKIFNSFDSEKDWDYFEKVVSLVDENEFYSIVKKLKGIQFNYDGGDDDMIALRDVLNTIKSYGERLFDKLNEQEHEEVCTYATSPYFFCALFHCFSPETVFAANRQLLKKSRWFYDSGETLLHYEDVVSDELKKELNELYEENRMKFFCPADGNKMRRFDPMKLARYYLQTYTLCQAINFANWDPDLPYPVTILKIYNIAGRVYKNDK